MRHGIIFCIRRGVHVHVNKPRADRERDYVTVNGGNGLGATLEFTRSIIDIVAKLFDLYGGVDSLATATKRSRVWVISESFSSARFGLQARRRDE